MSGAPQFNSSPTLRVLSRDVNDDLLLWKSVTNHSDGWYQIGITADEDEVIAGIRVRIVHHGHSDVDVGPFLLVPVEEPFRRRGHRALSKRALNALLLEVAENDLNEPVA